MRMRFLSASSDKIRFEQLGDHGMLQVADGENVQTLFPRTPMDNGPMYSSMPASGMPFPLHSFYSDFPLNGNAAFLFSGIAERVESAEVLRQEEGCFVVSVRTRRQHMPHSLSTDRQWSFGFVRTTGW